MNKKMYYACNEVKNTGADIVDRGAMTDISGKLDKAVFDSVFSIDKDETTQSIKGLRVLTNLYADGNVTAFSDGGSGEGGGGTGGIGIADVEQYLSDNGYVTQPWVNSQSFLRGITKTMVESVLTGNITSHIHNYLPVSGGNLTGALTVNNNVVYHAGNYNPAYKWIYNPSAGCLVKTNIMPVDDVTDIMFTFRIIGNTYSSEYPVCTIIQGYFYHVQNRILSPTGVNMGSNSIDQVHLFIYEGRLCLWFMPPRYQSFGVYAETSLYTGSGDCKQNLVYSVSSSAMPSTGISRDVTINLGKTYNTANANLSTVDWSAKNMTVAGSVKIGSVTLSDDNGKLKIDKEVYSTGGVTAFGDGTVGGGTGGGGMGTAELEQYLTDNGYATQSWVGSQSYLKGITKAMVEGVLTGNITSHTHSYLPVSGGNLTGTLTVNGDTVYHSGNLDAVRFDEYQSKSAAEREMAAFNIGMNCWKSGYGIADLDSIDTHWFCAGNTPFGSTNADDMIRYIHSGHTDDANVRHVGQLWFNGEDIRLRNKKGSGAWSALKSCIVKYCGGRLSQSETDKVVQTPSGLGSWIDSEQYGIIMQYAAGQIGYGATVHQAVFTPLGFMTRYNVRPEIGQTTGWSEWTPLFGDASPSVKGLVRIATNSGSSSDYGCVPTLLNSGKLSENVLPRAYDIGRGHIGAVEVVYNAEVGNSGRVPMVDNQGILSYTVLPLASESTKGSVLLAASGAGTLNAGKVVALGADGMLPQEFVPSIPSNVPDASATQKGVVRLSSGVGDSRDVGSAAQVFDNGTISPYNLPEATVYVKGALIKASNSGTSADYGHVPVCGATGKLDRAVIPTTETKIKYGASGTYYPSDSYDVIDVYLPGGDVTIYLPATTIRLEKKIRFQGAGGGYSLTVYDGYGRSDVFSFSGSPGFIKGYYIYKTFGNDKLQLVSKYSYSSSVFDND
ncbi:MAG: hypothetical protein PUB21_00730 [Bacteroidales bacterium]|nr:hypothetical protein [Bacteroidales bacterium]